jgi:heparin/heparan-sulfate lyase
MGFNKRSVAHSMMFAVDPAENFPGTPANDGGTRYVRSCPTTPQQASSEPMFANGRRVSSSFGPSAQRPAFSYFAVDLKSAYSDKIQSYVRTFCFLNFDNPQTPAALVVLDNMTTARPEFKKYWQLNSLNPPERTAEGVTLHNTALGRSGRVGVRVLRPAAEDRQIEILSGQAAYTVFGQPFIPPDPQRPEANGHRVLFSWKTARASDVFLCVMPICDERAPQLPIALAESPAAFVLTLADRMVVLSKTGALIEQPIPVRVPADRNYRLLLAGLAPGAWTIRSLDGKTRIEASVAAGKNTAFVALPGGNYTVDRAAGERR